MSEANRSRMNSGRLGAFLESVPLFRGEEASERREFERITGFDAQWYLARYPDVAALGFEPARHYLTDGLKEGRFAGPLFDSRWYLEQNPDVRESGIEPLTHYVKSGAREGRRPNACFDPGFYLSQIKDPAAAANPMAHYLRNGSPNGPSPSPYFDAAAYSRAHPEIAETGANPLAHFLHNPMAATHGWLGDLTSTYVAGWACRLSGPGMTLTVWINDKQVGEVTPWLRRADVQAIGLQENSGYFFKFPQRLASGDRVAVRDVNGRELMGSPRVYLVKPLSRTLTFIEQRASIAAMFLSGEGLEIGAFTQPTDLPRETSVSFYDKFPAEVVRGYYDEHWGRPLCEPHFHGNAEHLEGIDGKNRFDFVIANHVIEHFEDPIAFFKSLARVLRAGGRAMVTAPNKRESFDSARDLTTFDHILRDHLAGPKQSRLGHYQDWVAKVDNLQGEQAAARVRKLDEEDFSIHYHVWDETTFVEFVAQAIRVVGLPFKLILVFDHVGEIIVILERI